jgi:phage terminase large subunit
MPQAARIVTIRSEYTPRKAFIPFHMRGQRWAVLVCHRRAGKTIATLNDLIKTAITGQKRDGRYAFILPQRNQAKDVGWSYLKRYATPLLSRPPNESELRVDLLNGAMLRLYGADNPDALRGPYLDGVVLDEFADMRPSIWYEVVRPMLADRHGSAIFIGTPKGKNEFWELYNKAKKDPGTWFSFILRASESGLLPASELADLRKDMGEDTYMQEMECSFEAATKGAFYAEELREMQAAGRICKLEIDRAIKVHTSWDLGVSDSTAVWFVQSVGRERRLVDYYESSGVGLDHYVDMLYERQRRYGWRYGDHFFPLDVQVRELSTGKSRVDTLKARGVEVTLVPQHNLLDGINAVRKMLARTWIDPERCERGLEALRQYCREYDHRLKDWKQNPLHNWTSHGSDALRYFAAGFEEPLPSPSSGRSRSSSGSSYGSGWGA